ncbi:MAG: 50S ribosomal protein L18 [Proteobacteria bacterium]|nr:50S ribosomal protein L18 [Pseudomonadota bacterium]
MAGHIKISNSKERTRLRRKSAIRKRIAGTAERPRLSVFRSAKHIYVQAIDDVSNRVLVAVSDLHKDIETEGKKKKERARVVGQELGKKLLAQNVERAIFDRNGYIYHGRVKEVAEGAREAGLKF